jgi:hypothetical protein
LRKKKSAANVHVMLSTTATNSSSPRPAAGRERDGGLKLASSFGENNGHDSDHRPYNSGTDDEGGDSCLVGSSRGHPVVTTFTCHQCNLSFDSLAQCARHMALEGHSSKKATTMPLEQGTLRRPARRSSATLRGRGHHPVQQLRGSRRSLGLPPGKGDNNKTIMPASKAFAYECRRCSFATVEVDKLFVRAALGHKCVAGEESGSTVLLVMCAVCRVFLLDKTAVESHR